MPNTPLTIERCATVADDAVRRLRASKQTARDRKVDRQSLVEIDYAILQVSRVASGIRALDVTKETEICPVRDVRFEQARVLLRELLPTMQHARNGVWKQSMIDRIQELLKD